MPVDTLPSSPSSSRHLQESFPQIKHKRSGRIGGGCIPQTFLHTMSESSGCFTSIFSLSGLISTLVFPYMIREALKTLASNSDLILAIFTPSVHFISCSFLCLSIPFLFFIPKILFKIYKNQADFFFFYYFQINSTFGIKQFHTFFTSRALRTPVQLISH